MKYSSWSSNLLAWNFCLVVVRAIWAATSDIISIFFWNSEQWSFNFYLQVYVFHKCDSQWPKINNLYIAREGHMSRDQWYLKFWTLKQMTSFFWSLLGLDVSSVLGLRPACSEVNVMYLSFSFHYTFVLDCNLCWSKQDSNNLDSILKPWPCDQQ